MKQNETSSNSAGNELIDELGEEHIGTSWNTPLRANAFDMDEEEKVLLIAYHFKEIMQTLGLDLNDDSLKGTPLRVGKLYVKEIFSGLDPRNKPQIALFENKYGYRQMLVEKNIVLYSNCEHHFVPIIGKAHIVHPERQSYRAVQAQPHRPLFCAAPSGTGAADQANCGRVENGTWNRRCRCSDRRCSSLCFLKGY